MSSDYQKRKKLKGRKPTGSFVAWPHVCAAHPNFASLSPMAKGLLFQLFGQYRGYNQQRRSVLRLEAHEHIRLALPHHG